MATSMIERIQKLLAKAESTEFPAEAEALTEKATQLMAEHAISEAMVAALAAGKQKVSVEQVEVERIIVPNPYSHDRMIMLNSIALAMGGYVYYNPQPRDGYKTRNNVRDHTTIAFVVGFRSDIEMIMMLFNSLIEQEASARKFEVETRSFSGMGEKKVFSATFVRAFGQRIGQRLREIYKAQEEAQTGSTALVLVDKKAAVDQKIKSLGLKAGTSGKSFSSAGYQAGTAAGNSATINPRLRG